MLQRSALRLHSWGRSIARSGPGSANFEKKVTLQKHAGDFDHTASTLLQHSDEGVSRVPFMNSEHAPKLAYAVVFVQGSFSGTVSFVMMLVQL